MHEAAIAQSIFAIAKEKLAYLEPSKNGYQVLSIDVRIGEFKNVDPETLSFAFDSMKDDIEGIKGCNLNIELQQAVALCRKAKHNYHPNPSSAFRCSRCGSGIGSLLCGDELEITKLTFEERGN